MGPLMGPLLAHRGPHNGTHNGAHKGLRRFVCLLFQCMYCTYIYIYIYIYTQNMFFRLAANAKARRLHRTRCGDGEPCMLPNMPPTCCMGILPPDCLELRPTRTNSRTMRRHPFEIRSLSSSWRRPRFSLWGIKNSEIGYAGIMRCTGTNCKRKPAHSKRLNQLSLGKVPSLSANDFSPTGRANKPLGHTCSIRLANLTFTSA
jgi:hypothetical protein